MRVSERVIGWVCLVVHVCVSRKREGVIVCVCVCVRAQYLEDGETKNRHDPKDAWIRHFDVAFFPALIFKTFALLFRNESVRMSVF